MTLEDDQATASQCMYRDIFLEGVGDAGHASGAPLEWSRARSSSYQGFEGRSRRE